MSSDTALCDELKIVEFHDRRCAEAVIFDQFDLGVQARNRRSGWCDDHLMRYPSQGILSEYGYRGALSRARRSPGDRRHRGLAQADIGVAMGRGTYNDIEDSSAVACGCCVGDAGLFARFWTG